MNFLDAHKIVHNYAGAMGKGADKDALLFRPISYMPFQDKDKVIDAYKIFYAHMIFHNTRTQEQYEQYDVVLKSLKWFVPDAVYEGIIKCVREKEMKQATDFMSDYMDKPSYRKEEVEEYFSKMIDVKDEVHQLFKDGKLTAENYLYNYCIEAYDNAGIEYQEDYFYYFLAFPIMRRLVDDDKYKQYYSKYRNYILDNQ